MKKNLYHEIQDHGTTLMVSSVAKVSKPVVKGWTFHHRRPGAFLSLLESGNMGIWASGFPRPAISNAQKEINRQIGNVRSDIGRAISTGIENRFK